MTVGTNSQCTRKCRKNECGETKSMIKEMVWNKYLQEEGLDKYPEIVKLIDSDSEAIKLVSVHPESGNFGVTAFKKNDDFPKS
jgi:hypothetical protein